MSQLLRNIRPVKNVFTLCRSIPKTTAYIFSGSYVDVTSSTAGTAFSKAQQEVQEIHGGNALVEYTITPYPDKDGGWQYRVTGVPAIINEVTVE